MVYIITFIWYVLIIPFKFVLDPKCCCKENSGNNVNV